MNEVQAQEEVDKIMSIVDKNNSGAIDYTGKKKKNLNNFISFLIIFFFKNLLWLQLVVKIYFRNKD